LIKGTVEGPATSYCLSEDDIAWFREQIESIF